VGRRFARGAIRARGRAGRRRDAFTNRRNVTLRRLEPSRCHIATVAVWPEAESGGTAER